MRESLMYGSVRGARGNSRPYREDAICCGAYVRYWHQATDLPPVTIRSLSEAQRTCREVVGRVDPTLMTRSGAKPGRNLAAQQAPDLILATHRGARNRMPRRHR